MKKTIEEQHEFDLRIEYQKKLNSDSFFLPKEYNNAIIGYSISGNIIYNFDMVVDIFLEENKDERKYFDNEDNFYDWGYECMLNEYDHDNYLNDVIPPYFFHPIS